MIVLNLLNQLFGRRDSISRADIATYQKDKSQRQRIEESAASDEFDSNALEGWAESELNTDAMQHLDERIGKKFGGARQTSVVRFLLASLIVGSVVLLYITYQPAKTTSVESDINSLILDGNTERTEVDLSPEIEALIEISDEAQVKPQELIAKNIAQTKQEQLSTDDSQQQEDETVPPTPQLPVFVDNNEPQVTSPLIYQQAKEIYLKELKLIDYRAYRDGEITTERLRYSGIPANQENSEETNQEELVWEKVNIPYIEYIDKTMDLIAKNKYKKALSRLELILEKYPDDINANFYSGLSYFNLGKNELAIERFDKSYSIQFGNFYEEARWFKSLALESANRHVEAQKLWKAISAEKGFYAKEAERKLNNH